MVNLTSHNRINSEKIIACNPFIRNNNSLNTFIIKKTMINYLSITVFFVVVFFHKFYNGAYFRKIF